MPQLQTARAAAPATLERRVRRKLEGRQEATHICRSSLHLLLQRCQLSLGSSGGLQGGAGCAGRQKEAFKILHDPDTAGRLPITRGAARKPGEHVEEQPTAALPHQLDACPASALACGMPHTQPRPCMPARVPWAAGAGQPTSLSAATWPVSASRLRCVEAACCCSCSFFTVRAAISCSHGWPGSQRAGRWVRHGKQAGWGGARSATGRSRWAGLLQRCRLASRLYLQA